MISLFLGSIMLIDSPLPELQIGLGFITPIVAALSAIILFLVYLGVQAQRARSVTGEAGMLGENPLVVPGKPEESRLLQVIAHDPADTQMPPKGKLPAEVVSQEYQLEYGTDKIEVHKDAIKKGDRVLLIDDLLATGGTALASAALIEKLGGTVVEMAFIVDLPDVGGKKRLMDKGYKVYALTEFEGD